MSTKRLIVGTVVLVGLGFAVMMAGFVYDLFYAGIPYQDPPSDLAAEYAVSRTVAETLFIVGALIASLGSLMAIWTAFRVMRQMLSDER